MDQHDQFLGLQIYTWVELMSILRILFSGEERAMLRRAAMAEWEREHTSGPEAQPADRKFPLEDPYWNNNDPDNRRKWGKESIP
jgi:hypothetical protein